MGQWNNYLSEVQNFFPWVSFVAGIGGSLHCVGMCGGLVTATCDKGSDIFRYQTGRLLGYLFIGVVISFFGHFIQLKAIAPQMSWVSGIFVGLLFIYWGWKSLSGKRAELPLPKFVGKFYQILWAKLIKNNRNFTRSFFTGLISIFLPCGLLYGVALGALALGGKFEVMFSLFFFWLGTLPSMIVAPGLFQKLITPFKKQLPKTYALSLILIGLLTIGARINKFQPDHHAESVKVDKPKHSCH